MKRPQTFADVENWVLAELLMTPRARELAKEAGIQHTDFADPANREAFTQLRLMQFPPLPPPTAIDARGWINTEWLADRMTAQRVFRHRDQVDQDRELIAALNHLVFLIMDAPHYGDDLETVFPDHLDFLRRIGEQRRALWGQNA